jgi:hypothetical protein
MMRRLLPSPFCFPRHLLHGERIFRSNPMG